MLSRNLSRKSIPKVFSLFYGGRWKFPNCYKLCALLPKSEATSDHGWLIFKDVSGQCALNFVGFLIFFILHPTPCCPVILAVKIFQKVSPYSLVSHENHQTTTSGVLPSQNHKQLQTTGGLFSKTFRANVPFDSFYFLLIIHHHAVQKSEP